ncbi:MAG: sugar O-acetyltransferase [Bacilli bacterium]|nr:sugar O-acetyltransferase [Bacilli bacterium]
MNKEDKLNLEKMLRGEVYDSTNPYLCALRDKCHDLCNEYNATSDKDIKRKREILAELGVKMTKSSWFQAPIHFDYGCFIEIGEHSYANFNLTILDTCPVKIGNNVFIGPNVSIVTPIHPMRYQERNAYQKEDGKWTDDEWAKPITIEDNCWIATGVIICPGVTIKKGSVIGAGAVVIHDIPENSFAAGNPCKVIRKIEE